MLNWTTQWYRRNGPLSLDELADQALEMILTLRQGELDKRGNDTQRSK
jgi:hypothetical protein